jgi:hypothetical protein
MYAKLDRNFQSAGFFSCSHTLFTKVDIGKIAYLRPRQPRVPSEKGWLASLISRQSASIHLSGLNLNGS